MGQKLHHGHRSVFRKRSPLVRLLPAALTVLGVAAIVAVGFFGAKYLMEHPLSHPQDPASTPSAGSESVSADTSAPADQPASAVGTASLQAFTLPAAALHGQADLAATLQSAAQAGFNGVVVDMKDADGTLYYRSATDRAAQVNSAADDAFTVAELRTLFADIRQAGLQPIVRLYAFRDNAAARVLADARISPTGNSEWVWYDNNPANGGKAWLNPYADAAHLYIIDLARELRDAGAAAILLDGVQFPAQTSGTDIDSTANGQSRAAALTAFIQEAQELLGDHCPVILACTGESAQGEKTQVYGGNPLTFGADATAPLLRADDVTAADGQTAEEALAAAIQAKVHQMLTRIKVVEGDKTVLTPMLDTTGLDASGIRPLLSGCKAGGADSYILSAPDGQYDFAALQG